MRGSILVVEDDTDTATILCEALRKRGFDTREVSSAEACLDELRRRELDVVITDVNLTGMSGFDLCDRLARDYPDVSPIVITAESSLDSAIAAIRAGAFDYIAKPVKLDVIAIAVERALQHVNLRRELRRLRTEAVREMAPDSIAGSSAAIRATIDMIARVAASDATILITGESGTGKELVARALHNRSGRGEHPFVAINCAAMPAPLLESELFGHVRGAFTDAKQSRSGLFVQAGAGTILLDEIGEMPIEMQVKLLRVLQERRVRPVGGDEEVPFKARVITATNRDLEIEVDEKRFREDLFYRINVVQIPVPPLRDRTGDVLLLAHHFLTRIAKRTGKRVEGISEQAAKVLLDYDWPGNVRELENCIERAVALCRFDHITLDDLPRSLSEHSQGKLVIAMESPLEMMTVDEMTKRYVRQVMVIAGGNKAKAARILGIDRRSLYRRLEGMNAPPPEPGDASEEPEHAG